MVNKSPSWDRIPAELRALPQWVLAGADKAPLAINDHGNLHAVSSTRPSEWMTYERAAAGALMHAEHVTEHTTREGQHVRQVGLNLGYVLHEGDPYTCVDLDTKDAVTHPGKPEVWTTADDFQRHVNIVKALDSYTERSRSGKGVHVWVRADIGRGFRRDGVEVYSRERYIIMTGDVYINKPIQERGEMLRNMVGQMRPIRSAKHVLVELEPYADDWYIFQTAAEADNADKFWKLWRGQWPDMGYPSQSEADLALMSMFTFYSDSNEQCRRLFRASGLGQREKATKDNHHVDHMLRLIRARMEVEQSADLRAVQATADVVASLRQAVQDMQGGASPADANLEPHREVQNLAEPGQGDPDQPPPPAASAIAQLAPVDQRTAEAGSDGLTWPPGFVGTIARFVYQNSPRPIKEVSIVAALGLMAGIAGKAWHIPQSGLNLYIILVARSAIGKEAMHSGLASLVGACTSRFPFFGNFVDFNEYVSGPALVKSCLANPSFVNVSGEWGRRLKRLSADDGKDGAVQTLRTQMTNLYQKSGPQSIAGGLGYSNNEASVASVAGVAYSMIGESTPGTFYDALTESMMEDGFLSRFIIVGYDGDRPERNPSMLVEPDGAMVDALASMAGHAYDMIQLGTSQPLGRDEEAAAIIGAFGAEADTMITSTNDESRRQMWNRAELKALRVAALLAVGDHYLSPCIRAEHIEWAISLVRQDITMMTKKLESGDIGSDDKARERTLVAIIRDYVTAIRLPKSYSKYGRAQKDGLIPRAYMQARVTQRSAFYKYKLGLHKALDDAIGACVANGWLMEVRSPNVIEGYGLYGKVYRVLDLPDYSTVGDK